MVLRLLVLALAIVQLITPWFLNPFSDGQDAVRAGEASQLEPAGYAFAIWGPIYILALVYAAWQLTPSGRADPVTRRVAPLAIVVYGGSPLWLLVVQYGPLWASMPILAAMAACASAALVLARGGRPQGLSRPLAMVIPFGLYAGWTCCATFVNVAEVAPQYGFDRFGLTIAQFALASIAAATGLAGVVLWLSRGALAYAFAVLWALSAIWIAGRERDAAESVLLGAGSAMAAVILFTLVARAVRRGSATSRPLPAAP